MTEASLVPDPSLSIRDRAVAAWPGAWQGKNYRDILATLGYDVDRPWRDLPQADRDWILFTDEQPVVTVHAEREAHRIQRPYQGTYQSARRYVLHTLANTNSAPLRRRALQHVEVTECPVCHGAGLQPQALAVTFADRTIAELTGTAADRAGPVLADAGPDDGVAGSIVPTMLAQLEVLVEVGLGYLALSRATPTLSSGERQRLRLATALRSTLFGVVYVLDEPSAGLHPHDTLSLLARSRSAPGLGQLAAGGRTRSGPDPPSRLDRRRGAGSRPRRRQHPLQRCGGRPGRRRRNRPPATTCSDRRRLRVRPVRTRAGELTLRRNHPAQPARTRPVAAARDVHRDHRSVRFGQVDAAHRSAGRRRPRSPRRRDRQRGPDRGRRGAAGCVDNKRVRRRVDRRSTGWSRWIRNRSDARPGPIWPPTPACSITSASCSPPPTPARERGYSVGRFSFNVAGGRCENCQGEGFVAVELLFLPGSYSPCPVCHGARYNPETLEVRYRGRTIAEVLELSVDDAAEFFADNPAVARSLHTLREVGLGYLSLGQPATELSGGEAQRIKLATELQRNRRGHTLYLLDEPTTGLHPADVDLLVAQLHALVDAGNSVIVAEHDMRVVAGADHVIDLGPGGGGRGRPGGRRRSTAGGRAGREQPNRAYLAGGARTLNRQAVATRFARLLQAAGPDTFRRTARRLRGEVKALPA